MGRDARVRQKKATGRTVGSTGNWPKSVGDRFESLFLSNLNWSAANGGLKGWGFKGI